jgi:hypothetical protein
MLFAKHTSVSGKQARSSRGVALSWMGSSFFSRQINLHFLEGSCFSPQGRQEMNFSKNWRFPLSTFTAALLVLAWNGPSHADQLWVASGDDFFGHFLTIDIDVQYFSNSIVMTVLGSEPEMGGTLTPSDMVGSTSESISNATITATGVMGFWTQAFPAANSFLLTSTGPEEDLQYGVLYTVTITGTAPGTAVNAITMSTGNGDQVTEIPAVLVPEPSSMVLATFGALGGFLAYSLRRQIAT